MTTKLGLAEARELGRLLVSGAEVSDVAFDRVFPGWARRVSHKHWTQLSVARQALELLDPRRGEVVLDVGSGVGKFCLAGALLTEAHFVGVEQRPRLVAAAKHAAKLLGARRATFSLGDALKRDWRRFKKLYLFNPFPEPARGVAEKLVRQPRGTRVVTFHGIGAPMPDTYELLHQSIIDVGALELWVCRRSRLRALR